MKNRKAPGEDKITAEMLKMEGNKLEETIRLLLNKCLLEVCFLTVLENARTDSRYSAHLRRSYFPRRPNNRKAWQGSGQGDIISPKLITLSLESVFKKLDWNGKGLKIDGLYLSHLRFADDIELISTKN